MKRREQTKPNALDEYQYQGQRSEADDDDDDDDDDEADHDVLQPNIKFASLNEQTLFYGDIPDDDPIY
jgi:hypothetical protein